MGTYKELEIYKDSYNLLIETHKLSLKLPSYELYEEGSQLRRSSKSVCANIVEGYGRKRYKMEFIRYLIFSLASCDETILHLNIIKDTQNNLSNSILEQLLGRYDELGKKIFRFIEYVEKNWKTQPVTRNSERKPLER